MTLTASLVDLEGPFDRLQVTSGTETLATITTPFHDNVDASQVYTFYQKGSSPLVLRFTSDASFRQKGFFMQYSTEAPASGSIDTSYDVTFALGISGECTVAW